MIRLIVSATAMALFAGCVAAPQATNDCWYMPGKSASHHDIPECGPRLTDAQMAERMRQEEAIMAPRRAQALAAQQRIDQCAAKYVAPYGNVDIAHLCAVGRLP